MVKQYTENQYDDDLTLGNDEYDDSYYTDADDLFEFSTDDESPISRLKSLVLSIDWEITDEVLFQFNEELLDLKSIWAGETINLVYVQALEKIGKYIYQNKADSHPNAIKLLLTFYYNLEKIVSSVDLSDEQRKEILLEDVKKFENLKRQIKQRPASAPARHESEKMKPKKEIQEIPSEDHLLRLKAIVLGIDWEITDQDLNDLRKEVTRLEEKFSESRPKLILLQGIGTLAAYIKLKKSNAHPDAFKVMQLFYESLEKIVHKPMGFEAEKSILFPAVEKFNSFKALLGPTIAPESLTKKDEETYDDYDSSDGAGGFSPALADVPAEEAIGFQAEQEALALGLKDPGGVSSHIENFFGSHSDVQPSAKEDTILPEAIEEKFEVVGFGEEVTVPVGKDIALQGVDVGNDDEEDSDGDTASRGKDIFAPIDFDEDGVQETKGVSSVDAVAFIDDTAPQKEDDLPLIEEAVIGATETIFPDDNLEFPAIEQENGGLDREKALQGVNVETDADDDSDELSLPMEGEELAPALAAMDEESLFSASTLDRAPGSSSVSEEIVDTIDDLFLDQKEQEEIAQVALPEDLQSEEPEVVARKDEELDEELIVFDDWLKEENKEEETALSPVSLEVDTDGTEEQVLVDREEPASVLTAMELSEEQESDNLNAFFAEGDLDQSSKDGKEIDALFESLETEQFEENRGETISEDVEDIDLLFAAEEEAGEQVEEAISLALEGKEEDLVETAVSSLFFEAGPVEDEVVFELAKDEPEVELSVGQLDFLEKEPAALPVEEAVDTDLSYPAVESTASTIAVGFAATETSGALEQAIPQPLDELSACIDSLKIELNDAILVGLFAEIEVLRNKWDAQPLERTFLQLISTVAGHIESYRYEASAEAFDLLMSLRRAISSLKGDELQANQEILLGETRKVLDWQQGMLARQAVKTGNQLTFVDPVRTEREGDAGSDAQRDFDNLLEDYKDTAEDSAAIPDFHAGMEEPLDDFPHVSVEEVSVAAVPEVGNEEERPGEFFADDLKKEIASLRQTLQMEIAELRREIRKD